MSAQSEKLELLSAPPSLVGLFFEDSRLRKPVLNSKARKQVGRGPRRVRGIGGHEVQGHLLVGS